MINNCKLVAFNTLLRCSRMSFSSANATWRKKNDLVLRLSKSYYKPSVYTFATTSSSNNHNHNEKSRTLNLKSASLALGIVGLVAGIGLHQVPQVEAGEVKPNLPTYTTEEVAKHNTDAATIWISYKNGVYDITEFIESHPGGDKILMAAGASAEPFWSIYTIHQNANVYEMLESYRIGNLKQDASSSAAKSTADPKDPYASEPKRHPLLHVLTQKPFNAETPKAFSAESFITPNELHFKRNHMPVPHLDAASFELEVVNELDGQKKALKLTDVRERFPIFKIPVTLQCSGNKRRFMNERATVNGLMWDVNAISNAEWTGVKLRDLLVYCGVDLKDERIKHVHFEGLDKDPAGAPYAVSIPKEKAFNEYGDVLVAFQMNGEDIPLDHGFPLRAVVPGVVGARSVKWLGRIVVSENESMSHWQKNDYKVLPPSIKDLKNADFSKLRAVQDSPVQSAICEPVEGGFVSRSEGTFKVKGYAFSGGGNSIESVIVSIDGGKTWVNAKLNQADAPVYRSWSWALWEVELNAPFDQDKVEIMCVATDSNLNTQPETDKAIWNARGLMNNSWHRINVQFK